MTRKQINSMHTGYMYVGCKRSIQDTKYMWYVLFHPWKYAEAFLLLHAVKQEVASSYHEPISTTQVDIFCIKTRSIYYKQQQ